MIEGSQLPPLRSIFDLRSNSDVKKKNDLGKNISVVNKQLYFLINITFPPQDLITYILIAFSAFKVK